MVIGIQIAINVAVSGELPGPSIPAGARITDDGIARVTDNNEIRIID